MTNSQQADPLVAVNQLAIVGFESSDSTRLVDYYEHALGFVVTERADGASYLATGPEHHCVVIASGGTKARTLLGFQIKGSLDDAQRRLGGAGIEVARQTYPQPGVPEALVISEPSGTPLLLFEDQEMTDTPSSQGIRPLSLGHVAAFTSDIEIDQKFYVDVLGFRWSDSIDDWFTFLRCDQDHHAINFLHRPPRVGMDHVAYKLRDIVHLRDVSDHLAKLDVRMKWGPGRHGPGHNLFTYHEDPDGNTIELFAEVDVIVDERTGRFAPRPWHEEFPQYPKVWRTSRVTANQWGTLSLEMEEAEKANAD